jgi:hypothetical protein
VGGPYGAALMGGAYGSGSAVKGWPTPPSWRRCAPPWPRPATSKAGTVTQAAEIAYAALRALPLAPLPLAPLPLAPLPLGPLPLVGGACAAACG